ncbi:hypothetical protein Tcan_00077 [Toxocara canis]|uniref:Uncharacterized protein n=1 Tax=Toxocara canis TaxID=6265 RepID=A0A0B2V0S0_TOXCA|nr:hypothetical protein Tcan_00077 [Toxocara canis]
MITITSTCACRFLFTYPSSGLFVVISIHIFSSSDPPIILADSRSALADRVLAGRRNDLVVFETRHIAVLVYSFYISLTKAPSFVHWISSKIDRKLILDVFATSSFVLSLTYHSHIPEVCFLQHCRYNLEVERLHICVLLKVIVQKKYLLYVTGAL